MFKLGGKLIQDADKRAEYAFKVQEMVQDFMKVMLQTKTYPWIDGLVKLAYAGEAIVKGLIRPAVATGLFVWGILNPENVAQLQELGAVGDVATAGIFGSLPAWGVDRGLDKRKKKKEVVDYDDEFPF